MSNQSIVINFCDIIKSPTSRIDTLCLIRGAYIDGSLFSNDFSFSVDVTAKNKADILTLIGKRELVDDAVGFQALCIGSAFRPMGAPEMKKVNSAQALEILEQGIDGALYNWESEGLVVDCQHEFHRNYGFFWGRAVLTVNGQYKINIDFDLDHEANLVTKYDFNGLTAVDVTTKVIKLSQHNSAILITTFAGGKVVENAFCC